MKTKLLLLFSFCLCSLVFGQTSVTVDAQGNVKNATVKFDGTSHKLYVNGVEITGSSTPADASTTVKGITKLSVAPVSPTAPIAVGDNDSRMTNARTPTSHGSSHAANGSDPLTGRIGNTNLPLGAIFKDPANGDSLDLSEEGQVQFLGNAASVASDGQITATNFAGSGTTLTFPGSLSIASGKTLTASNTLTLLGTDGASLNIGAGGTLGTAAFQSVSWITKTGNYTAISGDKILANTSGGVFTITLPASPTVGDVVSIADSQGTFATNALTVGRNSQLIGAAASNMTASTDNAAFMLVFAGGTMGWQVVRYQ